MNNSVVNQYVVNNNDDENNKKKKNKKLLIILIIIFILLCPLAYFRITKYQETTQTKVVDIVYNYVENSQSYYDEESGAYYTYFILYNYKDNELSPDDLKYKVTVSNKEGSTGMFKMEDLNTKEVTEYKDVVEMTGIIPHDSKREQRFKIYILPSSNDTQKIEYEIKHVVTRIES